MKTNFQMLRELNGEYTPKERGVVTMTEIYQINKALCLDSMDELQLRNLRDMAVMFYHSDDNEDIKVVMEKMDKMSAITAVIDQKLWNIGAAV